jgi:hypothetical protein
LASDAIRNAWAPARAYREAMLITTPPLDVMHTPRCG